MAALWISILNQCCPKPKIVILGRSPVARFLAQLGSTTGYAVSLVSSDPPGEGTGGADIISSPNFSLEGVSITPQTFVVVATQGEGDEEALEQAARAGAAYVAFVASKTKAAKVFEGLQEHKASQPGDFGQV